MESHEPLIERLQIVIHWSVRILAILMVFVIVMGVVDVAWTLYQKLVSPLTTSSPSPTCWLPVMPIALWTPPL